MVEVDKDNSDPGYLCGRLFNVLECAQTTAIRNVNATIVDPVLRHGVHRARSSVPPAAQRSARASAHVEPGPRGARVAIETDMEEIMSSLEGFPKTLNLEQQGLFALGYYHQRAENSRQAQEATARRNAQQDHDDNEPDAE